MINSKNIWPKLKEHILDYILILLFFIFIVFLTTFKLFLDDDVFWHLAIGRFIIQNFYIPSVDVFGFITSGTKWIPYEWGWDVITYLTYQIGGYYSLSILRTIIAAGIFIVIFIWLKKSNINLSLIIFFSLLLSFGMLTRFSVRPLIISYFFLILILFIFDNYQNTTKTNKKILIYLPLIFLVWVNLHMEALLGIVVFGLFVISEEIDLYIIQKKKKDIDVQKNNYLLLSFVLSLISLLINPHFISTYFYVYNNLNYKLIKEINEWKSPFNTTSYGYYYVKIYLFFLCTGVITIYYSFKIKKSFPVILFIVIGIFSMQGMRFIFDFMVIIFCIWVITVNFLFRKVKIKNLKYNLYFKFVLIIFLLLLIFNINNNKLYKDYLGNNFRETGFGINENFFPERMMDFIRKENIDKIGKRPFNNYVMGGYFIWNFPDSKNFIDSRFLNDNIYFEYKNIELCKPGFENMLEKLGIDYVMYSAPYLTLNTNEIARNIVSYLSKSNNTWKLVYWDDGSFLFVKNIPQFYDIISKYEYKYITPYNIIFNDSVIKENYDKNGSIIWEEINRKLAEEPNGKIINFIANQTKIVQ